MNSYPRTNMERSNLPDYRYQNRQQQDLADHNTSPLRNLLSANKNSQARPDQVVSSPNRIEEELYERRRQEELRKQLPQFNENQRQRDPYSESGSLALSNSQAKQSAHTNADPYGTFKSNQSFPERDRPVPSHFTLGPSQPQYTSPLSIQAHISPQLHDLKDNIQKDNSSLMRRLNLVMQELDRVNREKDDIYQRLKQTAIETSELQKILQSEDNVDKVNTYMRDDIIYERDRNQKIKQQIKDLDLYRGELIAELRKLQNRQDDIGRENQELNFQIDQKTNQLEDLDKEMYFTNEKVKQINNSIENLKQALLLEGHDKSDLDRFIRQLMNERNDLLSKLELLNRKYDECVREISFDRTEMEKHNKKHAKLILSKIIFTTLEKILIGRYTHSIQKIKEYCDFDMKTHQKLGAFAKVLEKAGYYRMKNGLTQWYSNAIQPVKMRQQSKMLSIQRTKDHLRLKYFISWKKAYDSRIRQYKLKNQAITHIWNIQVRDKHLELKRAFQIWKDLNEKADLQKARVKKLIWKLYFNKLNQGFNAWQNHTANIDVQVRLNLLAKQFSQKQYLTILFHKFKSQVSESKRKRIIILFHCVKAWKDHLTYQKFMMATSIQAMHFRRNQDQWNVKLCFDAFRLNKEQEKLIRIHQVLHEQELPMINSLVNETDDIEVQRKFKTKQKACESVKKMISKQLFGYFLQWKGVVEDYKEKLRTTMKDKIIKVYMDKIRQAFNYWKTIDGQNILMSQQMIIQDYQSEGAQLQNEVIDLQRDLQNRKEQLDCSQSKRLAIGRWRDRISEFNAKEDGSNTIIRRMRARFLRQAFDLYLEGVKFKKQQGINQDRCSLYNKTRDERMKKKVYNFWKIYIDNHVKAKRYWYRMFLRLDLGMKQIAIKKWREQTQKLHERDLKNHQNEVVEAIEDLNNQVGQLHQDETSQKLKITSIKDQMTTQARRIISNAFARFYYVSETRGFEKWKEYVEFEKRKERLFKKYIDHRRKSQFYMVKAALQNWIMNCKINEKSGLLKKEEQRVKDAQFQLELQSKNYTGNNGNLSEQLEKAKYMQRIYNQRLQKSVSMIVRKVDNNDHMSQKRYILTMWRQYVKREVNFLNCIVNVMKKSFLNEGLMKLRNFSRADNKQQELSDTLNRFRMKFWKRTCGNAFSIWRSGQFSLITQTLDEVECETQQQIQDHENKKAVFKGTNSDKSAKIIQKNNIRNLFQGWKNVTQLLKFQNAKNEKFNFQIDAFQKKMALFKWNSRKNATKLARIRSKRLREKVFQIRLRQYFYAIKNQFNATKGFLSRLSNLARINDHHALLNGFNCIQTYSNAQRYVHQTKKINASKDIETILGNLIKNKKQQYLNDLRVRSLISKKEKLVKSFTLLQTLGNKLRHFFIRWKESANERTLAIEMQEEGPVREEVFEAKIQLRNLKEYMNREGYDQKDIQEALKEEKDKQHNLLLRSVKRFQHYNEDKYVLPKMLDRWRMFVHLRKLFKYWLGFADKKSEYIKSDLHFAFDKWRQYHPKQSDQLKRLKKAQIDSRHLKNKEQLDKLAENLEDKENNLENLNNQREVLVENYVKGQKLALSIWVNYRRREIHQNFLKWFKIARHLKNMDKLQNLRNNMDLIDRLKNKINQFEIDNETMANENEELRQFSMDGYELSKNVQALTAEREKLSVDLADKAQMIRKLLNENEKLTGKLRSAQDDAQNLIKSTMAGSSGFKSGGRGTGFVGSNYF